MAQQVFSVEARFWCINPFCYDVKRDRSDATRSLHDKSTKSSPVRQVEIGTFVFNGGEEARRYVGGVSMTA